MPLFLIGPNEGAGALFGCFFFSIFYQKPDRYYMYIVNMQLILELGGISLLCEAMMSRRTSQYYLVLFRLRDVNGVMSCDVANAW